MGDCFVKLQEMYSFSLNVCIEVYGIFNTGFTPSNNKQRTPQVKYMYDSTFLSFIEQAVVIIILTMFYDALSHQMKNKSYQ